MQQPSLIEEIPARPLWIIASGLAVVASGSTLAAAVWLAWLAVTTAWQHITDIPADDFDGVGAPHQEQIP